jgi:hypothetical protein
MAIGALGLGTGFLLDSSGMMLFFAAMWLVPLTVLVIWRRGFIREASINPDQSLKIVLYSGQTRLLVGAQTLTYRLKQIGRMQYFVITGAGSTSLRVAVFERAEIELVRSLFGRFG